jgi:hypothetical protein
MGAIAIKCQVPNSGRSPMMHNFEKESPKPQNPAAFAYIFSCSGQEMATIIFSVLHISNNFIIEQTKIREDNDARDGE